MSIRILCAVLAITCVAKADETAIYTKGKAPSKYLLIPAEMCASMEVSQLAKKFCSPQRLPFDLKNYSIVPSLEAGYVQLAVKNSAETDNLELLCYRCTLEKGAKDKCSRFENVWGNRKWTESCPKVKDN